MSWRAGKDLRDVQHFEAPSGAIDQVDHVVEPRREPVNVLAIDRRNEALVDALIDRRGQQVGFVLDVLDRLDVFVHVPGIAEQRVQHARGRREVSRQLVEQLEELVVTREQAAEHGMTGGRVDT